MIIGGFFTKKNQMIFSQTKRGKFFFKKEKKINLFFFEFLLTNWINEYCCCLWV